MTRSRLIDNCSQESPKGPDAGRHVRLHSENRLLGGDGGANTLRMDETEQRRVFSWESLGMRMSITCQGARQAEGGVTERKRRAGFKGTEEALLKCSHHLSH